MIWSKMKQQLESFLCPALVGRVEYRATGYRYLPDKMGRCYIAVDKKEVMNMSDLSTQVKWFQTEQEIKNELGAHLPVSVEEIEVVRKSSGGNVPEDRLVVMARNRKISTVAKDMLAAQGVLCKSDFYAAANKFMTSSIEENLDSPDILLNIMGLVDRRLGKKRLLNMSEAMSLKHPIVQYFYDLRKSVI